MRDHRKEDRMESFFLAETTKYLYLLFDTDNFIHNSGQHGTTIETPNGKCVIDAGGYIFNTEAHPIDPAALHCCHTMPKLQLHDLDALLSNKDTFRGVKVKKLKNEAPIVEEPVTEISDMDEITTESSKSYQMDDEAFNVTVDSEEEPAILVQAPKDDSDKSILPDFMEQPLPIEKKYNLQELLMKIRSRAKQPTNITWEENYSLLTCRPQPFLQKMSIYGEFFNEV